MKMKSFVINKRNQPFSPVLYLSRPLHSVCNISGVKLSVKGHVIFLMKTNLNCDTVVNFMDESTRNLLQATLKTIQFKSFQRPVSTLRKGGNFAIDNSKNKTFWVSADSIMKANYSDEWQNQSKH